jgi:(2Fe-2S) ferredoxin
MLSGPSVRSSESEPKIFGRLTPTCRADIVAAVTRRHLFVCTNPRASGRPACGPGGGEALIAAVQNLLIARNATDVLVTPCGCLGPCFDGPNAVVYPDGVWYGHLVPDDAPGLVDHLIHGTPLATKVTGPPGD